MQNGTDGGNGVYRYTSTAGAFPNSSYNAENYWVDVVFAESAQDDLPPTVTGRSPAVGATGVPVGIRPSVSFSEPVTGSSVVMELRNAANQVVTGTTAYDAATVTATFTPQTDLAYSSNYTVNVSGARDPSGNTMAPISWSFQTSAPPPPGIDDGPGGPIAVVTSSGNPSSSLPHRDPAGRGAQRVREPAGLVADGREPWRRTRWSCWATSRSATRRSPR